ncbi:putative zinc-regulated transporter 1 [Phaeomoniella chlamydospora]|uniref:Putative zinc-regulated transporter 1 n=1 Tax=Phaeomoniella chlamydospora TaxID=158046 RepID=A0A0G2E649_PHACM|nr:putative zinc-regulated transporter 1 [Phaeomoniella chlamydospora]
MTTAQPDNSGFDPYHVNLSTADPREIICYLSSEGNDYNGNLGARISAIFVILILSTVATFFPVAARRLPKLRIPTYVYLFARYFGAGVIVTTAFIHLLDPAYGEIGPDTCVGMTGHWADYAWCPAIVLTSVIVIFLLDFGAERYVEIKYGAVTGPLVEDTVTTNGGSSIGVDSETKQKESRLQALTASAMYSDMYDTKQFDVEEVSFDEAAAERSYKQQIAAFFILEFGVIVHSVVIGLNLGVVGDEFSTLYPVLVFHQSFEGLGIGARMSAIPFKKRSSLPWLLCAAYGLTTPIAIAIGLGLRTTYNPNSFTANVVSGVLDSMSAGILIYTGLVELLARDFIFNPVRTNNNKRLTFMIVCVLLGAGLMALLGKWA